MATAVGPAKLRAPRRDAILSGALTCFLTHGVSGTTIDGLQRETGASVGSIYHFFGSKDALAIELYRDTLEDYLDAYLAVLQRSRTARAGITGSVRSHLRWVATNESRARYLFYYRESEIIAAARPAVDHLNQRFYQAANAWLAPHVARGDIKTLPPRLYQALWMGPCVEYARLWLARSRDSNILSGARALEHAAWEALRGPNAAVRDR